MNYWFERIQEVADQVEGVSRGTTKGMLDQILKDIADEYGIVKLKK